MALFIPDDGRSPVQTLPPPRDLVHIKELLGVDPEEIDPLLERTINLDGSEWWHLRHMQPEIETWNERATEWGRRENRIANQVFRGPVLYLSPVEAARSTRNWS